MRCCVPFCVNNSEIMPDPQNVTFHRLPTEALRHAAWLEALGIQKENESHKVLFVCSLHFKESDFYTTKGGQRAVQRIGVPKTEQVCIICLDTDRKLYSLNYFNLNTAYEKITGISLKTFKIILSPKVCSECGQRLINFEKFRDKSLRANMLLLELSKRDDLLRIQNIKSINRKKYKLKSNLTKIIFKPNYYDFTMVWNEDKNLNNVKLEKRDRKNIKTENRENKDKNIKIEDIVYGTAEVKNELSKVAVAVPPKEEGANDIASDEEFLHDDIDNDNFLNGEMEKVINNDRLTADPANINNVYKTVKIFKQGVEIDVEFSSDDVTNFNMDIPVDVDRDDSLPTENVNNDIYPLNDDIDLDFPDDNDMGLDRTSDNGSDIEFVDQAPVKACKKSVKSVRRKKSVNKYDMEAKAAVKSRKRKKPLQGRYLKRKTPTGDMELFKVTVLTYEEQVADIQCKKDTPLYKNSTYKCTYCFKGYQYEDAYESHMEQHTDKYGVFECAICGIHTKSRQKLLHHLNMTHIVRYTCTKCPFFTRHRNTAKSHARWHNGIKSKCKYCDAEFSKMTSLLSHLRKKHPSDQVCTLCGYSFIGERGLALHVQKKHQFDEPQVEPAGPTCAACGIRFANDAAYEQHVRVSPKHAAPDALEPNEPRWHKPKGPPRRKGDQTVTCEQCGMTLKGFKYYTYHFKRHHRDKIRTQFANAHERCLCELCGRVLQHSSALKSHMLVHTGKKDVQCSVCDKRFYHQRQLTMHMDTHNEAKRTFDCPVCARSFTSKSNKNRHLWTHTQVSRPFKCHACPKTFVYPSERKIHVNHAHANQPYPKKNKTRVRSSRPRHTREPAYAQMRPHDGINININPMEMCADASYGSEASAVLNE